MSTTFNMAHILAHINNHCYKMNSFSITLMLIPFSHFPGRTVEYNLLVSWRVWQYRGFVQVSKFLSSKN